MSHALLLALLIAAPGQTQSQPQAQSPSAAAGNAVTRSLNVAPPAALVRAPAPVAPAPVATPPLAATPVRSAPAAVANPPRPQPQPPASTPATTPLRTAPSAAPSSAPARAAAPAATSPRPAAPVAAPPSATTSPTSGPTPAAPPAMAPAAAPAAPMTVLDAPAIRALPFTVDLPAGLTITTGRPGPNFTIWTIRRGEQPLVMVYAGPSSQFPIYSGQMVETPGRASVVATEEGRRVALEHLFTRTTAPQEVHVWITSVDGADRALAERIGQSIDVR